MPFIAKYFGDYSISKLRDQHALVDGTDMPMLTGEGISSSESPKETAFRLVIVSLECYQLHQSQL